MQVWHCLCTDVVMITKALLYNCVVSCPDPVYKIKKGSGHKPT